MEKRRFFYLVALLVFVIVFSYFVFAADDYMALQGNVNQGSNVLDYGNLTVRIYDAPEAGNLIYDSGTDFNNSISQGKFDVILGNGSQILSLDFGRVYYIEMYINSEKFAFGGAQRQPFQSSVGQINSSFINSLQINASHFVPTVNLSNATGYLASEIAGNVSLSQIFGNEKFVLNNQSMTFEAGQNLTLGDGGWFKGLINIILGTGTTNYLTFNGTTLNLTTDLTKWLYNFSLTKVSDSELLDNYNSDYFMPLNTTPRGNFDFNGGWTVGGLSIIDGNIFAQTGFFYNISSLEVSNLKINGSIYPGGTGGEAGTFNNTFDVGGDDKYWWRNGYFGTDIYIGNGGNSVNKWLYNMTNAVPWNYNQTYQAPYNYNQTLNSIYYYNMTNAVPWNYNQSIIAVTNMTTGWNYAWYNYTIPAVTNMTTGWNYIWYNHTLTAITNVTNTYGYLMYNQTLAAGYTLNWTGNSTAIWSNAGIKQVGIGTTTPTEALNVTGNISASNNIKAGKDVFVGNGMYVPYGLFLNASQYGVNIMQNTWGASNLLDYVYLQHVGSQAQRGRVLLSSSKGVLFYTGTMDATPADASWTTGLSAILDTSGRLGIGTPIPNAPLQINGTQGAVLNVTNQTNSVLFATMANGGRVGVGTSAPARTLEVNIGASTADGLKIASKGTYGELLSRYGAANYSEWSMYSFSDSQGWHTNFFVTYRGRGTVTTPAAISSGDWIMSLQGKGYGGTSWQTLTDMKYVQDTAITNGNVSGRIEFYTTNVSGSNNLAMTIRNNGSIGIGTSTPVYKLDVAGNARVTGNVGVFSKPDSNFGLNVSGGSGGTSSITGGAIIGHSGYTNQTFGVLGYSAGADTVGSINYGVYGFEGPKTASEIQYAGYFEGDTYIAGNLSVVNDIAGASGAKLTMMSNVTIGSARSAINFTINRDSFSNLAGGTYLGPQNITGIASIIESNTQGWGSANNRQYYQALYLENNDGHSFTLIVNNKNWTSQGVGGGGVGASSVQGLAIHAIGMVRITGGDLVVYENITLGGVLNVTNTRGKIAFDSKVHSGTDEGYIACYKDDGSLGKCSAAEVMGGACNCV